MMKIINRYLKLKPGDKAIIIREPQEEDYYHCKSVDDPYSEAEMQKDNLRSDGLIPGTIIEVTNTDYVNGDGLEIYVEKAEDWFVGRIFRKIIE